MLLHQKAAFTYIQFLAYLFYKALHVIYRWRNKTGKLALDNGHRLQKGLNLSDYAFASSKLAVNL